MWNCKIQYRMRIFNLGTLTSSDSRQITALLGCWSFHGEGFDWAGPFWYVLYVSFAFMPGRSSSCFAQPYEYRNSVQLFWPARRIQEQRAAVLTSQTNTGTVCSCFGQSDEYRNSVQLFWPARRIQEQCVAVLASQTNTGTVSSCSLVADPLHTLVSDL
jgi:hypothetical protein